MITFVIPAHNEEDTVGHVVNLASTVLSADDRLVVVDSGSTDGTAKRAEEAGAEVLVAPLGKGAAMAVAVAAADTEWFCFLDADLVAAGRNIAEVLRDAVHTTSADHVLGQFDCGLGTILSNTVGIYEPLVAALFPEISGHLGSKPLTGFRAIRRDRVPASLPTGYGVEAHLNIEVAMSGGKSTVVPIGQFSGKFKPHLTMGHEIAEAILDAGHRHGRLPLSARPAWMSWVTEVLAVISVDRVTDGDRDSYLARLLKMAHRPLPPRD